MARSLQVEIVAAPRDMERRRAALKEAEGRSLTQPTSCPTCLHREARILARENKTRTQRARWAGRLLVAVLVIVLGSLAFIRFGSDPLSSVQR
jgi:4-hydroxy-3-methylbut-2-en-1-yl diphosphate synthase IspG/GcpE